MGVVGEIEGRIKLTDSTLLGDSIRGRFDVTSVAVVFAG